MEPIRISLPVVGMLCALWFLTGVLFGAYRTRKHLNREIGRRIAQGLRNIQEARRGSQ